MATGSIFLLVAIAVGFIIIKTFYSSGKTALSIFPDIHSVTVKFRDKTASGYSTKSWKTQFGGASKVMDIVVTENELWLKAIVLFAGINQQHDLLHRIPLHQIKKVKEEKNIITIDFKDYKGKPKQVVIRTKNNTDFLKSIKG